MEIQTSENGRNRQAVDPPFQTDNEKNPAPPTSGAVQSGTSTPDESSWPDEADGYSETPPGCNCGEYRFRLDDGRTVSRRGTKVFCPVHGVNKGYRDSFAAHAAWVAARSSVRRCDCYHVTITLHADDVSALGLSADDTKGVLAQLLPRLRKRLKRRDEDAKALVSLSPRPSDSQWHMHVLVLSKGCSTVDVMEVFSLAGTDTCVTTPSSREELRDEAPMSAETFAAAMGAYLFDNRIHGTLQGAETKFTAWGDGVGYFSRKARTRRQKYAEKVSPTGGDSAPARGSSTQNPTLAVTGDDEGAGDGGENAGGDGENDGVRPVEVGVSAVQSRDEYRRTVIRALMARMHTPVSVHGLGRCKLTWVEVGDEGVITCSVRPLETYDDEERDVTWRKIRSTDTPVVESPNSTDESAGMNEKAAENDAEGNPTGDEDADESTGTWGADMAEKYVSNARHRKVSTVLPDGRRHVMEYRDGEAVRDEKVPPRS